MRNYEKEILSIINSEGYVFDSSLHNGLANIIVKIKKNNNSYALKFYPKDHFKKEREKRFIKLSSDVLPTPKLIQSGKNFLILKFKEGMSGSQIFSKPENKVKSTEFGKLIGESIRKLHSKENSFDKVGFLTENNLSCEEYTIKNSTFTKNSELLKHLINEQNIYLKKYNLDLPRFEDKDLIIENDEEKLLIHNDICPKNILIQDEKISSFLDFEYAMIGSRMFDIAKANVLGIYLAYHTLGKAKHLDFEKYINGFYKGYGKKITYEELRPFYIYVLLNYLLFWLSSPILKKEDKDKILPVHLANLKRLERNEDLFVDEYK